MRGLRAIAFWVAMCPAAALAGEARPVVDMTAAPWRSLARVMSAVALQCTGFVVAPDRVVTAAHCLFDQRRGRFVPASAVHVQVAYRMGGMTEHRVVAGYRTMPGYDPAQGPAAAGLDVAVLHLDRALAAMPVAMGGEAGGAVVLGGYAGHRREVVEADLACGILGTARDKAGRPLLVHDCAGGVGTSGAPLLQQAGDGQWQVLGVHVAGNRERRESYAVPVAAWAGLLK